MKRIPDITTANEEYTFSDGIGMISTSFAAEVASRLGIDPPPSAFQVFSFLSFFIFFSVIPKGDIPFPKKKTKQNKTIKIRQKRMRMNAG